jgi:hypothetical protein
MFANESSLGVSSAYCLAKDFRIHLFCYEERGVFEGSVAPLPKEIQEEPQLLTVRDHCLR